MTDQPASTAPLAAALPLVQGHCPACGGSSLFLGDGGYITCSRIDCPIPDAASTLLWLRPDTASLRDRIAAAIYEHNNPGMQWADAHPDDLLAYGGDADAALAVRDSELEQLRAQVAELIEQLRATEAAIARVREAIVERRAEVADREPDGMHPMGTPAASWCDAVAVTCARIEDALRPCPESQGICCPDTTA